MSECQISDGCINDESANAADCILQNQIDIMGALSLLLRYANPDLVGKAGELDGRRDDLLQRHKATQRAIVELHEPGQLTLWKMLRKHGVGLYTAQMICNDAMLHGVIVPVQSIPQESEAPHD